MPQRLAEAAHRLACSLPDASPERGFWIGVSESASLTAISRGSAIAAQLIRQYSHYGVDFTKALSAGFFAYLGANALLEVPAEMRRAAKIFADLVQRNAHCLLLLGADCDVDAVLALHLPL